ncbi:MAG: type IV secretion protein DotU [Moraxellaceae bacterium]|nr:MAG: type IV secretion protein DotU [Moraxellaceae bacterium]
MNAASTLLSLMAKLRNTASHANVTGLFNQVSQELKQFEARLKQEGSRPEVVLAARYCLCAVVDEVVLNTPWGANSSWGQKTLLSAFHNETAGGEKFFLILDRMKQSPGENLHMLELLYLLVSFGFEGKYRVMDRGRDHLDGVRDELYHAIRRFRGQPEADLSLDWRNVEGGLSSMVHYIPLWVVGACVGAVMLLTYSGYRFALYNTTTPLYEKYVELEEKESDQSKP